MTAESTAHIRGALGGAECVTSCRNLRVRSPGSFGGDGVQVHWRRTAHIEGIKGWLELETHEQGSAGLPTVVTGEPGAAESIAVIVPIHRVWIEIPGKFVTMDNRFV